jgi:hypothetical protein
MRWFFVTLCAPLLVVLAFFIWQTQDLLDAYQDLRFQLNAIGDTTHEATIVSERALDQADTILDRVDRLSGIVDRLTTAEISNRLTALDEEITKIAGQLDVFQRIINPDRAKDILNVARLAEEVAARDRFEHEIKKAVDAYDIRLQRIDARIWDFQLAVLVSLVTILVAVIGGFAYLIRRDGSKISVRSPS